MRVKARGGSIMKAAVMLLRVVVVVRPFLRLQVEKALGLRAAVVDVVAGMLPEIGVIEDRRHNPAHDVQGQTPEPFAGFLLSAFLALLSCLYLRRLQREDLPKLDADAEGGKLAEVVRRAVELAGRLDLRFILQEPFGFKDWNDQLRARPHPLLPFHPEVPSVA